MSFSNWLSQTAIAGWVIAAILGAVVIFQWNAGVGPHIRDDQNQALQAHLSGAQRRSPVLVSKKKLEQPRVYEPRCDAPESLEESELCAQWTATKVAQDGSELAYWQNLISAAGFAAVVVALVFSVLATKAARDQVRLSRHALVDTDRAFVFPEDGVWSAHTNIATGAIETWSVAQNWRNSGSTPTNHLRMYINREVRDDPLPDDFPFASADVPLTPALIAPGALLGSSQIAVSLDEMREIIAGRMHMYAWGWVEYDDVFEGTPRHRTEFCYKWTIGGDPSHPERTSTRYDLYNRHNGADSECLMPIRTGSPTNPLPE